jgi:glucose-1-phosphate cytidylyltransferase
MTGGRINRAARFLQDDGPFFLTYGDGLSNIDLKQLLAFHKQHGKMATITGVAPPGRFGELHIEGDQITEMLEKPDQVDRYINGGFMVLEREFVARYCSAPDIDGIMLERAPLENAALDGQLMVHRHDGFWQCMDTMRDWELLNKLAMQTQVPWA